MNSNRNSLGASAAQRLRYAAFPRGSRRERLARWILHKQRRFVFHAQQGPAALARAIGRKLRIAFLLLRGHKPLASAALASGPAGQPGFPGQVDGLVSIVLPVYNQARLLPESVDSVRAQTYANWELIVIDDGSTDDVAAALAPYRQEPRIRLLTQPNQKLPKALSNGFDFARGEFWTWTSADNLMEPTQLEKLVAFLRAHPDAAMVYSDYLAIDDRGQPLRDPAFRPQNRRSPDAPEVRLPHSTVALNVVQDNFIGASFLYRGWVGRLLGDYLPWQGVEDYDYWMRANSFFPICHLGTEELLYRYRVHENSLNARAREHAIYDHAARLMTYEADRARFCRQPWTVYADEHTLAWLSRLAPAHCTLRELEPGEASPRSAGKTLVFVRADTLAKLGHWRRSADLCIAVWFAAPEPTPYDFAAEIQALGAVCFAADELTQARLNLLTSAAFRAAPGQALVDLALAYANNRLFASQTIPQAETARRLPAARLPGDRRLRVLFQVDDFLQGGLEQVVLDIAATLDPRRFEPTLLVLGREGPAIEKARQCGLEVCRLAGAARQDAYREFLREKRIDVVNAHYSLFGASTAAQLGKPFLQTIHNTYVWLSAQQIAEHRAAAADTTGYLCVSNAVAAYSDVRLGLPPDKMAVVSNGIDTQAIDAARSSLDRGVERVALGFAPEDFVFLCTASLGEVKAQLFLVRALAVALARNPRVRLALLGQAQESADETSYARLVRREIDRLGISRAIKFLGYHKRPQKFYLLADAFVLPSFIEGWSLALAEALYAGLPVVATDVGAARELLARGGRLLSVPYGSLAVIDEYHFYNSVRAPNPEFVEALSAALLATAEDPQPPSLTQDLRRSFACEQAYQAYARIYEWVASGGTFAAARRWTRAQS
jgi:glycosyltransferase involved in cell wall biosynthesis